MNKAILFLLFMNPLLSMEEDHTVIQMPVGELRSRSKSATPQDEFVARKAMEFHFDNVDAIVGADLFNFVRKKVRDMRESSASTEEGSQDADNFHRLNQILSPLRAKESDSDSIPCMSKVRKRIVKDEKVFQCMSSLMADAIREYGNYKEDQIRLQKQELILKDKQKKRAFIVTIVSLIFTAVTTVSVAVIENS